MSPKIIHLKNKNIRIDYIDEKGTYIIGLRDVPFQAIKAGYKKIEVRTNTNWSRIDYFSIKPNSKIIFINEISGETLLCKVMATRVYQDLKLLIKTEKVNSVSSVKNNTLDQVYKRIYTLEGYADGIDKYGLIAIELELIMV